MSINWTQYLHAIRKREVDMVFSLLSQKHFSTGLEIGAGDGFQTTLLAPHIDKLVSSDLNFKRIKESLKLPQVEYKTLDADSIEGVFEPNTFEFIFSSNVLEHVGDAKKVLSVTQPMLSKDGYAVHIIPSRTIKILYLLFYYPNLFLMVLDRVAGKLKGKPLFQGKDINFENNINISVPRKTASRLKRLLILAPHGNFPGHWAEFVGFGKKQWEQKFIESGYSIVSYAKGPLFSGYGFGISSWLRRLLENFGLSSEHIFVLRKMTQFESDSWMYAKNYLIHGSFRDQKKFVKDWLKKEKSAKALFNDFVQTVGNPSGKKILDIGFGNGIIAKEFIDSGALVSGLETEEELVKKTNNPNLYLYDGKIFPFDSDSFDYAYSTSVLEHVSYPEEVIKEVGRTLKPGGKFYLSFPNRYAPKETHTGLWFISWWPKAILSKRVKDKLGDWNLHFISYFKMKKMAQQAGLRIIYDTKSPSIIKRIIKKVLALVGIHYGVLLKTIIVVLEKS